MQTQLRLAQKDLVFHFRFAQILLRGEFNHQVPVFGRAVGVVVSRVAHVYVKGFEFGKINLGNLAGILEDIDHLLRYHGATNRAF